ncbi:hypothetical protein Sango_0565800 [Sesamum angolense]|uniref:Uncharacterized protein n=1 Tax=Sesamum angolense TaxID=2727404 RepID=A0AAE1X5G2_9LAMI|nr:hypothetical protein Sango_0565800 [Sesamum angolense]
MLNSICRFWFRTNFSSTGVVSPFYGKLCPLQLKLFSSAARPSWSFAKRDSFSANYLMKTWGLSREKAFSAAKHLNIESTEKPDSVIAFLKNHGFTTEQIRNMVRRFPYIIVSDPEKTLFPKIEFFLSLGISDIEVAKIFMAAPGIFKRSLEKHIIPSYSYIKSLFDSNGLNIVSMKKLARILCCDLQHHLLPNVEVLREAGVPDKKVIFLVGYQPRVFMVDEKRFRKTVEELKKMGFSPSVWRFVLALQVRRSMSKSMWEKKVGSVAMRERASLLHVGVRG